MSGPIVRRYGFPNFDKIFGDRGLQHGVEEEKPATTESAAKTEPAQPAEPSKARDEAKKG
jgi:hypothetical protein